MRQLQRWIEDRVTPTSPALATLGLLAVTLLLAACGKGGGSGY